MRILRRAVSAMGQRSEGWFLPSSRGQPVRIHVSCGEGDEQTRHVWGQFGYIDNEQRDQVLRCERCGSTETRSSHDATGQH
jgi:hypothetical protein